MILNQVSRPAILIVTVSGLLAVLVFTLGTNSILASVENLQRVIQSSPIVSSIVLFFWSMVLFLTVLPLGTATILLAGALLGGWVGWVQFGSLVLASMVIYQTGFVSEATRKQGNLSHRPWVSRTVKRAEERGILVASVLRIVPIIPSAVCSLICVSTGVSLRKFLIATLAFGWVRPVFFAHVGGLTEFGDLLTRFSQNGG